MARNALVQVRVEETLKSDVDALFAELGLDTPTAIRMFLKQVLLQNGLPFEVSLIPSAETQAAMREAEMLAYSPNVKRHSSFAEVLASIDKE